MVQSVKEKQVSKACIFYQNRVKLLKFYKDFAKIGTHNRVLIWPTFGQARAGGADWAYRRARPAGWRGRLVYREESNNFRIESDVFIKMNPFYSQISHIEIPYFN